MNLLKINVGHLFEWQLLNVFFIKRVIDLITIKNLHHVCTITLLTCFVSRAEATQPNNIIYAPAYKNLPHDVPFFPTQAERLIINDNYFVFSAVEPTTGYFRLNNLQARCILPITLSNQIAIKKSFQEAFASAFYYTSQTKPEEYGYFADALVFDCFKNNLYLHYGHIGSLKTVVAIKDGPKIKSFSLDDSSHIIRDKPLDESSLNLKPRVMRIIDEAIPYIAQFNENYSRSFYGKKPIRRFFLEKEGLFLSHTHCLGSAYQRNFVSDTCNYTLFEHSLTPQILFFLIGSSQFWSHIEEDAAIDYVHYYLNQQREATPATIQEIAQGLINHVDSCIQAVLQQKKSIFAMLIVFNWSTKLTDERQ